jgi:hypothetical protein
MDKNNLSFKLLSTLPAFVDGSDGSLWRCHESVWPDISSGRVNSSRVLLRVSDVLAMLSVLSTDKNSTQYFHHINEETNKNPS